MMEQVITVKVKDVYGMRRIYPVCDKALAVARIAGTKTLSLEVIEAVKALGFGVVVLNVETV